MDDAVEEHADRFSEKAADYDDEQDAPEYREAADLVTEHAAPGPDDVVLDLGTGTGAVAFPLAEVATVVARDPSEGMLAEARRKRDARADAVDVEFGEGRFRAPDLEDGIDVDVVVSNFAMHHLTDDEKRTAIRTIADLGPRRFVLGDVMLFGGPEPEVPFYSPEVDDPATVGVLADAFTDAGFALTAVERVHDQVGVLVGERVRRPDGNR